MDAVKLLGCSVMGAMIGGVAVLSLLVRVTIGDIYRHKEPPTKDEWKG